MSHLQAIIRTIYIYKVTVPIITIYVYKVTVPIRTIYIYKVTVPILGSQKAYTLFTQMLSAVLQLKVVTNVIVKIL
jgi:hypothetical protein